MASLVVLCVLGLSSTNVLGLTCEHFSSTACEKVAKDLRKSSPFCAVTKKLCKTNENKCFATFVVREDNSTTPEQESGGFEHPSGHYVKLAGCIDDTHDSHSCIDEENCHADAVENDSGIHFCCCEGNLCNTNLTYSEPTLPPSLNITSTTLAPNPSTIKAPDNTYLVYAVVPAGVILAAVFGALCYVWLQRRRAAKREGGAAIAVDLDADPEGLNGESLLLQHKPIRLLEIKARGRFGAVWRGELKYPDQQPKIVAVKIFPLQDKASWQAEQDIYNLPRMEHENILKFLGVERRGENLQMEFWLTSEFHERGSLCDFLKSTTVTWNDLCRIGMSMARGLTHLHEEIAQSTNSSGTVLDMKPAIAHRDFKSKNVLIRSDMTACIADFGLALIFEPGKSCGDTHGQVGTRRYMAPEVLEGAINFSRDAFLRIDMYACGLVLWELASRCTSVLSSTSCSDAQQGSNTNNSQQPTVPSHDPPPIGSLGGHNSPPAYNNLHCHPVHQSLNSPPLYNQLQPSTSIQTAGNSNSFNLHDGFHPGYSMSSTATTLPSSPSNSLEYKLPFEAEISNPSLEQMRDLVVNQKRRPVLKDAWRSHPGMAALCDTIEECWDQDAEARLSASCVMERIRSFQRMNPASSSAQQGDSHEDQYMNALNTAAGAAAILNQGSEVRGEAANAGVQATLEGEETPLLIINSSPRPTVAPSSIS